MLGAGRFTSGTIKAQDLSNQVDLVLVFIIMRWEGSDEAYLGLLRPKQKSVSHPSCYNDSLKQVGNTDVSSVSRTKMNHNKLVVDAQFLLRRNTNDLCRC